MDVHANSVRAALALVTVLASCGGDDSGGTSGGAATAGSTGAGGGAGASCNDSSWNVRIKDDGPFDSWVTGVVSDASCGIVIAGSVSVDLPGPDSLAPLLVAAYDAAGTLRWNRKIGDDPQSVHVALDADRNILLAASFNGTADFGGGALPSAGGSDVYVSKLDPVAQHLWSKRFGDASNQNPSAIAADSTGNVIVAGLFYGSVDFGAGALVAAGDGSEGDVFVAKFGPDGALLWNKRFGGLQSDLLTGLAVDASGALLLLTVSIENRMYRFQELYLYQLELLRTHRMSLQYLRYVLHYTKPLNHHHRDPSLFLS